MPRRHHRVLLTPPERADLAAVVTKGTTTAQAQRRARILLQTDRAHTPHVVRTDAMVAAAVQVSPRTVARVRAAWIDHGMACLRRPSRPTPTKLDGEAEARLMALACRHPPDGYARWTLRLLTRHARALRIAETLSRETVRRTLKKPSASPGVLSGS